MILILTGFIKYFSKTMLSASPVSLSVSKLPTRAIGVAALGLFAAMGFSVPSCAPGSESPEEASSMSVNEPAPPERLSLIGTALREPDWSPEVRARLEEDLAIAKAVFEVAPEREESFIWLGRRYGYLTRWSEAIDVFTRGLEVHPESYKLFRFRGRHRARNRELDLAIADYRRAAELVESLQDSFEPDGILNARHQYLGTYKSNIHYYLAQTSYAVGDYETTVSGMKRAMSEPLGQSPDRLVSTSYWLYLAHRKLGQHEAAKKLVDPIARDFEIIENFTYYESVLFFQGFRTREEVLSEPDAITRFAVSMDHHFRGEQDQAEEMWLDIVEGSPQGFWPAEAELIFAREATQ